MKHAIEDQMRDAYLRAIDRLSRSRDSDVRRHAVQIVETEDSLEHFRWCIHAPMTEIASWTAQVYGDLDEAAEVMKGGAA